MQTTGLLLVNPHAKANRSHPDQDARRIVELLARRGIRADVRVEPTPARARRRVQEAVRAGCPLVIAAGGDGTVEAVAPALVHTQTALGILPRGTYNNLAACLGIPSDLAAACSLLTTAPARPIDVGQVRARGARRPHLFLEQASLGLGPLLAPVGEGLEKGHWLDALRALPAAMRLEAIPVRVVMAGAGPGWDARTLLITICNAPRSGAALVLAPEARMDDGLLDMCVYDGLDQGQLAAMFLQSLAGVVEDQPGMRRATASWVDISTPSSSPGRRVLVAADADVVGETPARFTVLPGALRVVAPGPEPGGER
jgi:diacylglycerol kinase (ATP)